MLVFLGIRFFHEMLYDGKQFCVIYDEIIDDRLEDTGVIHIFRKIPYASGVIVIFCQAKGEIRLLKVAAEAFWIMAGSWQKQANIPLAHLHVLAVNFKHCIAIQNYVNFTIYVKVRGITPLLCGSEFLKIYTNGKYSITDGNFKLTQERHLLFIQLYQKKTKKSIIFPQKNEQNAR